METSGTAAISDIFVIFSLIGLVWAKRFARPIQESLLMGGCEKGNGV